MSDTHTEYRIVTRDGDQTTYPVEDFPEFLPSWLDACEEYDREMSGSAPHRVQSRTVTVTEWQDLEAPVDPA